LAKLASDWRMNWRMSSGGQAGVIGVENVKAPDSRGLSHAAEWSRTITGVSTHKALKLKTDRLLEMTLSYKARSSSAISGCFRSNPGLTGAPLAHRWAAIGRAVAEN
jgi:hypothetical protein